MDPFDLTVTDIHAETELIRAIKLARPHGEPLPSWKAGAHVKVCLPDGGERSYSLINTSLDPAATTRPHAYRLGVRLEQPSQGGSKFMHALKVGNVLSVSAPGNNFPFHYPQQVSPLRGEYPPERSRCPRGRVSSGDVLPALTRRSLLVAPVTH